mmetsp:Transcript_4831/g.11892  ORF Transcript_4831/g.11892 Transcript_4831/m.11892 type:complete len:426 (+) Transcript_4831:38-1315(+)
MSASSLFVQKADGEITRVHRDFSPSAADPVETPLYRQQRALQHQQYADNQQKLKEIEEEKAKLETQKETLKAQQHVLEKVQAYNAQSANLRENLAGGSLKRQRVLAAFANSPSGEPDAARRRCGEPAVVQRDDVGSAADMNAKIAQDCEEFREEHREDVPAFVVQNLPELLRNVCAQLPWGYRTGMHYVAASWLLHYADKFAGCMLAAGIVGEAAKTLLPFWQRMEAAYTGRGSIAEEPPMLDVLPRILRWALTEFRHQREVAAALERYLPKDVLIETVASPFVHHYGFVMFLGFKCHAETVVPWFIEQDERHADDAIGPPAALVSLLCALLQMVGADIRKATQERPIREVFQRQEVGTRESTELLVKFAGEWRSLLFDWPREATRLLEEANNTARVARGGVKVKGRYRLQDQLVAASLPEWRQE